MVKKSAQLALAHSAVNDVQNKMNELSSEQRLVQSELKGQIRSKETEVKEVDSKYRQKYHSLKLLVSEYRQQMDHYRSIIEQQGKEILRQPKLPEPKIDTWV